MTDAITGTVDRFQKLILILKEEVKPQVENVVLLQKQGSYEQARLEYRNVLQRLTELIRDQLPPINSPVDADKALHPRGYFLLSAFLVADHLHFEAKKRFCNSGDSKRLKPPYTKEMLTARLYGLDDFGKRCVRMLKSNQKEVSSVNL